MRRQVALTIIAAIGIVACGGKAKPPRLAPPPPPAPLPAEAYAHYLRGRLAMIDDDFATAIREFGDAADVAPDAAEIGVAYIDALFRADHRERARKACGRAQKRFPKHANVWRISGRVYRSVGLLERATSAYRRALELDRHLVSAYLGLATTYLARDQSRRAERVYEELLAHVDESATGHYRLAKLLSARGESQRAEAHLHQTLDVDPDHVSARVALARSLRGRGRERESIAMLQQAFDRSGGDPRVGEQVFVQLLEAGEAKAAGDFLATLDRDDLDSEARVALGYLYLQLGELEPARRLAAKISARDPESGAAAMFQARVMVGLGQRSRAVEILLAVAAAADGYPACQAYAVELIARAGEYARAATLIGAARKLFPSDVDLIASHSLVDELRGDPARARAVFAEALARSPDQPDLLYGLAELEDRLGQPARAIALVEKILVAHPDSSMALNFIGYSLADRGVELDRAEKLLLRAVDLEPGNGYVLDSYGWLLLRRGRVDEAEKILLRALRLAPVEPEVLLHLAELYAGKNDRARAMKLLEKAQSLRPEGRVGARIDAQIRELRSHK